MLVIIGFAFGDDGSALRFLINRHGRNNKGFSGSMFAANFLEAID